MLLTSINAYSKTLATSKEHLKKPKIPHGQFNY